MTSVPDCLFCKIIAGEIPSDKVYEDDDYFAFRDIDPKAPTHILVIPKEHIATVNDIDSDQTRLVGGLLRVGAKMAELDGCAQSGYRAVFNCNADAQQTVFHIHLHILGGRAFTWPPG